MNNIMTPAIIIGDDPTEKVYILLLKCYNYIENDHCTEDIYNDWRVKIGRQETYDFLKNLIKEEIIDPNESFIISSDRDQTNDQKDNITVTGTPITVFRFMKVMLEDKRVLDDEEGFDINEFDPHSSSGDKTILEI